MCNPYQNQLKFGSILWQSSLGLVVYTCCWSYNFIGHIECSRVEYHMYGHLSSLRRGVYDSELWKEWVTHILQRRPYGSFSVYINPLWTRRYNFFLWQSDIVACKLELDNFKATRKLLTTDRQQLTNNVDREILLSNWFELLPISPTFGDDIYKQYKKQKIQYT